MANDTENARAMAQLLELTDSWDVTLYSTELGPSETQWTLTIVHHKRGTHQYIGCDLPRVIRAAHHGERAGVVA